MTTLLQDVLFPRKSYQRWIITTEAMWTPCIKDVCTSARILGAFEVLLQQKRYTFRHDTVLHKVTEAFKTFILNVKEAIPISAKSSLNFVKKRRKCALQKDCSGWYLHHASDWILHKVIEALKTFILNIKEAVSISAKSSINFVKTRSKCALQKDCFGW